MKEFLPSIGKGVRNLPRTLLLVGVFATSTANLLAQSPKAGGDKGGKDVPALATGQDLTFTEFPDENGVHTYLKKVLGTVVQEAPTIRGETLQKALSDKLAEQKSQFEGQAIEIKSVHVDEAKDGAQIGFIFTIGGQTWSSSLPDEFGKPIRFIENPDDAIEILQKIIDDIGSDIAFEDLPFEEIPKRIKERYKQNRIPEGLGITEVLINEEDNSVTTLELENDIVLVFPAGRGGYKLEGFDVESVHADTIAHRKAGELLAQALKQIFERYKEADFGDNPLREFREEIHKVYEDMSRLSGDEHLPVSPDQIDISLDEKTGQFDKVEVTLTGKTLTDVCIFGNIGFEFDFVSSCRENMADFAQKLTQEFRLMCYRHEGKLVLPEQAVADKMVHSLMDAEALGVRKISLVETDDNRIRIDFTMRYGDPTVIPFVYSPGLDDALDEPVAHKQNKALLKKCRSEVPLVKKVLREAKAQGKNVTVVYIEEIETLSESLPWDRRNRLRKLFEEFPVGACTTRLKDDNSKLDDGYLVVFRKNKMPKMYIMNEFIDIICLLRYGEDLDTLEQKCVEIAKSGESPETIAELSKPIEDWLVARISHDILGFKSHTGELEEGTYPEVWSTRGVPGRHFIGNLEFGEFDKCALGRGYYYRAVAEIAHKTGISRRTIGKKIVDSDRLRQRTIALVAEKDRDIFGAKEKSDVSGNVDIPSLGVEGALIPEETIIHKLKTMIFKEILETPDDPDVAAKKGLAEFQDKYVINGSPKIIQVTATKNPVGSIDMNIIIADGEAIEHELLIVRTSIGPQIAELVKTLEEEAPEPKASAEVATQEEAPGLEIDPPKLDVEFPEIDLPELEDLPEIIQETERPKPKKAPTKNTKPELVAPIK